MLSSFMVSKKHDDICGLGVPALNSVGVACVNSRWDMRSYVSMTLSMLSLWMPTDTRMIMCCGLSTTLPSALRR